MKNWISVGLICGFTLALGTSAFAADLSAVVKTDLKGCDQGIPVIPQAEKRMFSENRIKDTLHGIWRGRVSGEYDKALLAEDGYLNVDYYMIIDLDQNEVLVLEQFTDERTFPAQAADKDSASWSFLMCGNENYKPAHPRQIHEFQKVSDNINDAKLIVERSTGLQMVPGESLKISDAWSKLVDGNYFDDLRFPAYAGGFFKPIISTKMTEDGDSVFDLHFETELRGGGATAAEFEAGVPIVGFEAAQFVGVSAEGGDYLVASLGNGTEYAKQSAELGGLINVHFEQVVIGPLAQ